jgi:hypothetical protein
MIILRYFTICVLSLFAVSCTSYAPRVGPSFTPGPNTVVVYGRLKFADNITPRESAFSGYRMALQLSNEETKKLIYVRFSKSKPIACARIHPGHYKLTGFIATDTSDVTVDGKLFGPEDKLDIRFAAEPNTAIYLGDFVGYVKYYKYGDLTTIEAGLTHTTNNFSETTANFHEAYPNLAAVPVRSGFDKAGK